MENGFYKTEQILVNYIRRDIEHKDSSGETLYIEHVKVPQYKEETNFVAFTSIEVLKSEHYNLKQELIKLKEDIEQVNLFGMQRDLTGKRERCREIVFRLRELEKMFNDEEGSGI